MSSYFIKVFVHTFRTYISFVAHSNSSRSNVIIVKEICSLVLFHCFERGCTYIYVLRVAGKFTNSREWFASSSTKYQLTPLVQINTRSRSRLLPCPVTRLHVPLTRSRWNRNCISSWALLPSRLSSSHLLSSIHQTPMIHSRSLRLRTALNGGP